MSTAPAIPREIEAVPTTLARIEGTVNLVNDRVEGLMARMARTEVNVSALQFLTQRLELDADARDKTVTLTALAVKTEKDNAAQTLLNEKTKAEGHWSPVAKSIALINGIAAAVLIYYQLLG